MRYAPAAAGSLRIAVAILVVLLSCSPSAAGAEDEDAGKAASFLRTLRNLIGFGPSSSSRLARRAAAAPAEGVGTIEMAPTSSAQPRRVFYTRVTRPSLGAMRYGKRRDSAAAARRRSSAAAQQGGGRNYRAPASRQYFYARVSRSPSEVGPTAPMEAEPTREVTTGEEDYLTSSEEGDFSRERRYFDPDSVFWGWEMQQRRRQRQQRQQQQQSKRQQEHSNNNGLFSPGLETYCSGRGNERLLLDSPSPGSSEWLRRLLCARLMDETMVGLRSRRADAKNDQTDPFLVLRKYA